MCVTLLSSPLLFTLSYPRNQSTVQKSMYLKSILNVLLIIAAVYAFMHRSLFDNASKRTKYRFCRGPRVEGRGSRGKRFGARVQNMSRINLSNCLLLLMFPRAQEVY